MISPGFSGTPLTEFTARLEVLLSPQVFAANTSIFPLPVPALTVTELVPSPAVIFQPLGKLQLYEVAFVTAGTE